MSERKRPSKRSAKKACEYSSESEASELNILSREPAYVCKACERAAARPEDLCQPERLFSSW
jgi:hypothetical protein